MLWGRITYEMMESYWPAVARGDEEAPPAMREWAVKLEAKPKVLPARADSGPLRFVSEQDLAEGLAQIAGYTTTNPSRNVVWMHRR